MRSSGRLRIVFLVLAGLAVVGVGIAQGMELSAPKAGQNAQPLVTSAPPFTTTWLNPLPQGMDLTALDFVDANTGAAVGSGGTILWTSDGGVTWVQRDSPASGWLSGVGLIDAKNAWVSADDSANLLTGSVPGTYFLHTSDGGLSWQRIEVATGLYGSLGQIHFTDAAHGLALCHLYSSPWPLPGPAVADLLLTDDAGATWTRHRIDPTADRSQGLNVMSFASASRGWVAGADYGATAIPGVSGKAVIYRTDDGGASWQKLPSPPRLISAQAISCGGPQDVWVLGEGGSSANAMGMDLYHSSDGGQSWQLVGIPRGTFATAVSFVAPKEGWIAAYHNQDSLTTRVDILHTTDGGASWTTSTLPDAAGEGQMFGLLLAHQDASHVCCVGSNGFMARTGDGLPWQRIGPPGGQALPPRQLFAVAFADASHGLAAGQRGTIWKTDDGQHWQALKAPGLSYSALQIATSDGRIIYALGSARQRSVLVRSDDAGGHWRRVRTNARGQRAEAVFFLDTRRGWIAGSQRFSALLLATSDGGAHWRAIAPTARGLALSDFLQVVFADPRHGWAAAEKWVRSYGGRSTVNTLLKTSDGGRSWHEVRTAAGGRIDASSVQFTDSEHGWAASRGGVWPTANGGATWRLSRLGKGWQVEKVSFLGTQGWALGDAYDSSGPVLRSYQGLFMSNDGGLTWQGVSLPGTWSAMTASGSGQACLVSSYGGIIRVSAHSAVRAASNALQSTGNDRPLPLGRVLAATPCPTDSPWDGRPVKVFGPPPPGFDPLHATNEQLMAYGFPPRPPGPRLDQGWLQAVEHAKIWESPTPILGTGAHSPVIGCSPASTQH